MGKSVARKILEDHIVEGHLHKGEDNSFRIDNVLMQDATGTMVSLQFEMLGVERVKTEFAIVYIDHNMIQLDYRNPEDHKFLQTFAARYGIHYSRPGNGICHQVNTERFAKPGKTLIGSDSHTPTAGAVGSLAIGAGGLEVAMSLAGHPFELMTPKIVAVNLVGELKPWVSAKDVILEMLRRYSVKGGLGRIYEFTGPSVSKLSVTQRATICNMITELGATTGIFPSDERTLEFLKAQQRDTDWVELKPDSGAEYDEEIEMDLSALEPLIAKPHNPDNVVPVSEVAGLEAVQVCLGSSVNSWYEDLAIPAEILAGHGGVHPAISMTVSPGSRQILDTISRSGVLLKLLHAGGRILEPACGPCVGMGQAPPEGKPSVRTFNRNFAGRSGTWRDQVYLCSPATAGATALRGKITDPRDLGEPPVIEEVELVIDDAMVLAPPPPDEAKKVGIIRGRNIKPPPSQEPLPEKLEGRVAIVLPDNISTGSITPDGVIAMADRSNVPALAEHTFEKEDLEFVQRAKDLGSGFIVAGDNYGQGSSREHAALAPKHLGIKGVIAKSFARIHRRNLIHQGLVPIKASTEVFDACKFGALVELPSIRDELSKSEGNITVRVDGKDFTLDPDISPIEREWLLAGGILAWARDKH